MNNQKKLLFRNKEIVVKELLPAIIWAFIVTIQVGLYILAIPYIFIEKIVRKQAFAEIGFRIKGLHKDLIKYWWLILLPIGTGLASLFLSKFIVPDYFAHVIERTQPMLVFDNLLILIPQLFILALAEEICFRGFFQRKLGICINTRVAIIITSLIFALGHFSMGSPVVVIYDITGIFIDSIIYGILFYKTKNIYICWISHLLANICGVFVIMVI
jgi:membrane protease YdiL (CAAX protease family)